MIDSPNENVKLTFEQLQQIDVVEKQLANLQSEIVNANKILKGTKMEADRATKEKIYQEQLLEDVKIQVEGFNNKKNELINDINNATTELNKIKKETTELNKQNYDQKTELDTKIKQFDEDTLEYNKKVEDFNIQSGKLLEDQLSIKTAKDAFLKATETVIW